MRTSTGSRGARGKVRAETRGSIRSSLRPPERWACEDAVAFSLYALVRRPCCASSPSPCPLRCRRSWAPPPGRLRGRYARQHGSSLRLLQRCTSHSGVPAVPGVVSSTHARVMSDARRSISLHAKKDPSDLCRVVYRDHAHALHGHLLLRRLGDFRARPKHVHVPRVKFLIHPHRDVIFACGSAEKRHDGPRAHGGVFEAVHEHHDSG